MIIFDPRSVNTFRFVSWNFDEETGTASFFYALDNGSEFIETFQFQPSSFNLDAKRRQALKTCLQNLFLVTGISYYKTAVPPVIIIDNFDIPKETAVFMENLYVNGLGEFAFRNELNLCDHIRFPFSTTCLPNPSDLKLRRRTLIPIGGGKDSIVTLEILKSAGEPITLFSLGDFQPIKDVAEKSKLPLISVGRRLSSNLIKLNAQGALNGHVPISAIIAFVLPIVAILYDFDIAVLSNERSASSGNLIMNNFDVNHQYTKSFEFEKAVSKYFKTHLLKNFEYFSFLRPFSELAIARLFSNYQAYSHLFTSCNSVFRIDNKKSNGLWCLNCAKCRSTFLLLAPFMKKESLVAIFGADLLNDEKQIHGYAELLGIEGHKPFDCVGEAEEYIVAITLLAKQPDWKNDLIVRRFTGLLPSKSLNEKVFNFSENNILPSYYETILLKYS
jgi:hypothetical protein